MATATVLDLKHPITTNNLVDIIEWLKEGAYVVIHNRFQYARYFHLKCTGEEKDPNDLKSLRVIYLDVQSMNSLLNDGEWEWYIKKQGIPECTCSLKKRMQDPNDLEHSIHLKLGFATGYSNQQKNLWDNSGTLFLFEG